MGILISFGKLYGTVDLNFQGVSIVKRWRERDIREIQYSAFFISGIKDILLEDWFDYSKVSELLEQEEGFRETVSLQGNPIKMA